MLFRIMEHGGHECALHATGTRPGQVSLAGLVTRPRPLAGAWWAGPRQSPTHAGQGPPAMGRPQLPLTLVKLPVPVLRLLAREQPERAPARPAASKQQPKTERAASTRSSPAAAELELEACQCN